MTQVEMEKFLEIVPIERTEEEKLATKVQKEEGEWSGEY